MAARKTGGNLSPLLLPPRRCRAAFAIVLAFAAGPAFGQADIRASVAGFDPAYFADSSPPSALEMVQLLPGFRLQEGNAQVRGYSGALGNVLIDGRPPASKQDTLADILKRIPRAQVARIELIRPGAAGIDMQGFALMVNVVRKENNAPRGRVEAEAVVYRHDSSSPRLAAEISLGSEQVLDLSAAVFRKVNDGFGFGPRNRYAGDGSPLLIADFDSPRYEDVWTASGVYRQPLLGGPLRLNALYRDGRTFGDVLEKRSYPSALNTPGRVREMRYANEFGLQYGHGLWDSGEGELVAIRRANGERDSDRQFNPGGENATYKQADTNETILRAVLRQRGTTLSLEGGAEGAINSLNNRLAYVSAGMPVILPAANVKVSEQRAELFTQATWHIDAAFTVEAGLRYEFSHLKQSGDSQLVKDLNFLKPRILATWTASAGDEVRLSYEREAGQLAFGNFVSNVMVNSNQLSAGNINLEPFTLWQSELAWEHRFAPGSLVLTVRRQAISNVVDRIPIYSPQGAFDGVGNIGNGRRDEFQFDLLMPLDRFWLEGMTLQASGIRRFSQVIDPTVGNRRHISNDAPAEGKATLIDEIPAWGSRWGVVYTHNFDIPSFRFNETRHDKNNEQIDAFVEYKPQPQWLVRLSLYNILDRPILRTRNIYKGPRNSSALDYIEWRPGGNGIHIGLNVQRTFGQ